MRRILLILMAVLALSDPPCAQAAGEATSCLLFIKKVELKDMAGDWKTAYQGSLPLDLASEDTQAAFDNRSAPEGQYVAARLTLDETVEITGSDGDVYTRDGGRIEIRGTATHLKSLPGDVQSLDEKSRTYSEQYPGPIRVTLDFDYADRDSDIELSSPRDFSKPFHVKNGSKVVIVLRADVSAAVLHVWPGFYDGFPQNDVMIFTFPEAFKEFSVRVDGFTATALGGIEVKF